VLDDTKPKGYLQQKSLSVANAAVVESTNTLTTSSATNSYGDVADLSRSKPPAGEVSLAMFTMADRQY